MWDYVGPSKFWRWDWQRTLQASPKMRSSFCNWSPASLVSLHQKEGQPTNPCMSACQLTRWARQVSFHNFAQSFICCPPPCAAAPMKWWLSRHKKKTSKWREDGCWEAFLLLKTTSMEHSNVGNYIPLQKIPKMHQLLQYSVVLLSSIYVAHS